MILLKAVLYSHVTLTARGDTDVAVAAEQYGSFLTEASLLYSRAVTLEGQVFVVVAAGYNSTK